MSGGGDEGFLDRWSRRKRSVPEAEPEEPAVQPEPADAEPEKTDEEILAEHGLPDPDTLVKGDDFRKFMGSAIPARLRNRALRRLWISDPVLANLDGMIDYGEDFTDAATVVENLQTAWQVGRGMLRDAVVEDEEAVETADPEPESATADEAAPEPVAMLADGTDEPVETPEIDVPAPEPAEPLAAGPRHMRFHFDDA